MHDLREGATGRTAAVLVPVGHEPFPEPSGGLEVKPAGESSMNPPLRCYRSHVYLSWVIRDSSKSLIAKDLREDDAVAIVRCVNGYCRLLGELDELSHLRIASEGTPLPEGADVPHLFGLAEVQGFWNTGPAEAVRGCSRAPAGTPDGPGSGGEADRGGGPVKDRPGEAEGGEDEG
jgi:hypothetical protein